jgi:hypothetical protein
MPANKKNTDVELNNLWIFNQERFLRKNKAILTPASMHSRAKISATLCNKKIVARSISSPDINGFCSFCPKRLLKKAHLRRYASALAAHVPLKYAPLSDPRDALQLNLFEQPVKQVFCDTLLKRQFSSLTHGKALNIFLLSGNFFTAFIYYFFYCCINPFLIMVKKS